MSCNPCPPAPACGRLWRLPPPSGYANGGACCRGRCRRCLQDNSGLVGCKRQEVGRLKSKWNAMLLGDNASLCIREDDCKPALVAFTRPCHPQPAPAWWPREATKNTTRPASHTGVMTVMSGRWLPPASWGWLDTSTSPSCGSRAGRQESGDLEAASATAAGSQDGSCDAPPSTLDPGTPQVCPALRPSHPLLYSPALSLPPCAPAAREQHRPRWRSAVSGT